MKNIDRNRIARVRGCAGFVIFCLTAGVFQARGEIIPLGRRTTWAPGIPGGIPNYPTQINAKNSPYNAKGDGSTDDTAAINSAISACPVGGAVLLPAGTYVISGTIRINKAIALRGAGPKQTILKYTPTSGNILYFRAGGQIGSATSITAGFNKGSTSITVADASAFTVGGYLAIRHLNPSYVTPTGDNGTITWSSRNDPTRTMCQLNRIAAKSGNTLTLERPLYTDFVNSPEAKPIGLDSGMGVEDLTVWRANVTSGGWNVDMDTLVNSWVKNVNSTNTGNMHFRLTLSFRCEIRNCIANSWDNRFPHDGDHAYGYHLFDWNSDHLLENNVAYGCRHSFVYEGGGSGNVIAYNYTVGNYMHDVPPTFVGQDLCTHGACPFMNLWEGNYAANMKLDNIFGTAAFNTSYRNYFLNDSIGVDHSGIWGQWPVDIEAHSWYNNVVGCVVGKPSDNGSQFRASGDNNAISAYRLGFQSVSTTSIVDPGVQASTYLHGNFDYVTDTILWASSNADHTLPNSLYLTSKPAWFGNRPWPMVDPNNRGTIAVTNLPAGYRYVYGAEPPGGVTGNQPPVVNVSANPTTGAPPLTVNFSSAGTSDPEGAALTYNWVFGDGGTSTAANPSHAYVATGTYTARLTVSDGANTVVSPNLTITVSVPANQPPVANSSANPRNGVAPLTVSFSSAGSFDPEGSSLTYSWNFGDGATSTTANPTHGYSAAGTYSARLTVSDGVNTASSSAIVITAEPAPPSNLRASGN